MTATIDRNDSIGASEIADVLSMGRGSPYEIWARKRGLMPERESTPVMRRGLRIEPLIREDVAAEYGVPLDDVQTQVRLVHPDYPFLTATLDCMLQKFSQIEEWKSVGYHAAKDWGEPGTSNVPTQYALQLTFQTAIAVAVYRTDWKMLLRMVPMETLESSKHPLTYDPDLGGMLIEAAVKFWQDHVLTGIAPAVSGTSAEAELFKKRFAKSDPGVVLVATPEQEALVIEALGLKLDVDKFEKALTAVKLRVQESMGDASKLVLSDGREVRWATSKGSPAWKKIAEELKPSPELIAKHTPEFGARPFVLPKSGGEDEE